MREKKPKLYNYKISVDYFISRYECLVRQLQEALKMPTSKLKKILPHKQKYFFGDGKDYSTCEVHGSEPQVRDWKLFPDDEPVYLTPCPSLHAVTYSSAESSEMTASKDGPTRLAADVSEKYLEVSFTMITLPFFTDCFDIYERR